MLIFVLILFNFSNIIITRIIFFIINLYSLIGTKIKVIKIYKDKKTNLNLINKM